MDFYVCDVVDIFVKKYYIGTYLLYFIVYFTFRLYREIRDEEYGNGNDNEALREKLDKLEKKFPDMMRWEMLDNQWIVALCTPLMKRVHENWSMCSEMLYVDSTGNFDREQYRVFPLLVHGYAGALPVGIVVTATEKGESLSCGLKMILEMIGRENAFYKKGEPDVVMTDNSDSERNGLRAVFPNSVFLLCIFHILQAAFRYVWKSENWNPAVSNKHKPEVYAFFKRLVYAEDENNLIQTFNTLKEKEIFKMNPKIMKYAVQLFETRELWALCYRKNILIRGHNTNNFSEATMRILKEKIFDRKRAYNLVQLVHFILSRIDDYYERKLIDICAGKDLSLICKNCCENIDPKKTEGLIIRTCETSGLFTVENTLKSTNYTVDVEMGVCTCFVGQNGAPCKHQLAVFMSKSNQQQSVSSNFFFFFEEQRNLLHLIATGSSQALPNWYKQLKIQVPDANNNASSVGEGTEISPGIRPIEESSIQPMIVDPIDEEQKENLMQLNSRFQEFFMEKSETDAGMRMFESFYRNFFSIKTDSAIEHALYNFGKVLRKKSGRNINVQKTSIARRKSKIGGSLSVPRGRPINKKGILTVHNYCKINNAKKKAPHSLSYCVQNNMSLGK